MTPGVLTLIFYFIVFLIYRFLRDCGRPADVDYVQNELNKRSELYSKNLKRRKQLLEELERKKRGEV